MKEGTAKGSELIIFEDGTLYHIDLKSADNIPKNLLFVGSASRVDKIAGYFDEITFENQNAARPEFSIKTGTYKGMPVGAFSCGIGPDNIEIVMTEFHALFEYDHKTDKWTDKKPDINIIRVGTSGTSLPDLKAGALAISAYSIGLDNLGAYYINENQSKEAKEIEKQFLNTPVGKVNPLSYAVSASEGVTKQLQETAKQLKEENITTGLTTASPGFFVPEGRSIGRIKSALGYDEFMDSMQNFKYNGMQIVNHEMETSALFRIAHEQLGYNVGAICLVLDNLATDEVLEAKQASERMDSAIAIALEALLNLSS